MKFLLVIALTIVTGCAVLKPPFHTSKKTPTLILQPTQILPGKLLLNLRVHAPLRIGTKIDVFRAVGDEDFQLWKSIEVSDFEEQLHRGLTLVDSKLTYGEEVFYKAQSAKDEVIFQSEEVSILKEKGPGPPENLRTIGLEGSVRIEWNASADFSHVIIYRRNIVEDSPIEKVSDLVADSHWIDDKVVPNGVYSYQLVAAKIEQSAVLYGPFSEPLYVTIENE